MITVDHLINLLLALIVIPIALLAQVLFYSRLANWWAATSAVRATRRIEQIKLEYAQVKSFKDSKQELIPPVLRCLIPLAVSFFLSIFIPLIFVVHVAFMTSEELQLLKAKSGVHLVREFVSVAIYILLIFSAVQILRLTRLLHKVTFFDTYTKRTNTRIASLEKVSTRSE